MCRKNNITFFGKRNGYDYFKCNDCSTIQLNPLPSEEQLTLLYEKQYSKSGHHDTSPSKSELLKQYLWNDIKLAVTRYLPKGSRVLDYGAGWGGLCKLLNRNNFQCEAVDQSEEMAAYCRYIDMEKYKNFNKETIWYVRKEPVATIMTSRGCPYNCVFCSTKVVWTRRWRHRSLESVFEEIKMLNEDYGIREFVINDDQFMTRKKRIHQFCDYFIENKMDISFSVDAGISIWLVDKELLVKMKKAGFYSLRFPIESGCKKTLEYVNKPVDLDKTKVLIEEANRLGFWTSSNIILGFPYETKEEIKESIQYVYDSALDFTSFGVAKPNAGSNMYEDFKQEGLLELAVVRGSDFYRSDYDTRNMTAKELTEIVNKASSDWFIHKFFFFLKPRYFYNYFLPKIKSIEDFRYFLKVCRTMFHT